MENKIADINNLLSQLSQEDIFGYEFVDYWDGDTTAIGMRKESMLIYISAFSFSETHHYDVFIEEFETGKIWKEAELSYAELVYDLKHFLIEDVENNHQYKW